MVDQPGAPDRVALAAELREVAEAAGLDAFGITTAAPFAETRRVLRARRQAGLDGGRQFTYRNPEGSRAPERPPPGPRSTLVGPRRYLRTPASEHPDPDP